MSITRPHKNGHFSSSVSNQCLKFGHKKHTKTADNMFIVVLRRFYYISIKKKCSRITPLNSRYKKLISVIK